MRRTVRAVDHRRRINGEMLTMLLPWRLASWARSVGVVCSFVGPTFAEFTCLQRVLLNKTLQAAQAKAKQARNKLDGVSN